MTPAGARQSSNYYTNPIYHAASVIDGDRSTAGITAAGAAGEAWIKVYFSIDLEVGKVVLEKGWQPIASCVYQVFIYRGDTKSACGDTFTYSRGFFYNGYDNTTIDCGGKRGSSVVLGQSECASYISLSELKVYTPDYSLKGEPKLCECWMFTLMLNVGCWIM